MLSVPPAMATSPWPNCRLCQAIITAFIPEPQTSLTVVAGTS